VRHEYADGEAQLVYAFDDGPEMVERVGFPDAPPLLPERQAAFDAALTLLHLIAGVSYYKAGVPGEIVVDEGVLDAPTARLLDDIYLHGLAEFAYQNKIGLRGSIRFPYSRHPGEIGIQLFRSEPESWIPAFAGMTSMKATPRRRCRNPDLPAR
jgi:hypothetical protein